MGQYLEYIIFTNSNNKSEYRSLSKLCLDLLKASSNSLLEADDIRDMGKKIRL